MPQLVPSSPEQAPEHALRVSEARYRRLFETARDGILLLNADTAQIEDVNPYLIEMLGYTHGEFLGRKLWEVGPFADRAESKGMFTLLQTTGYVRYEHLPLKTKAGAPIDVEFVSNTYDCEGTKVIQCNIRDITDRRAAETHAERRTQLYAALSQCNHAIVHSNTEADLFAQICRIAVQLGGFRMAWIGLLDVAAGLVRPVFSFGDVTGYLTHIEISVAKDSSFGQGPIGKAIREDQAVWIQDIKNDPIMAPWQPRVALSDWTASAALPLHRGGEVIGVFSVYSDATNVFDEPARELLRELAVDLTFALDGFAREARRKTAEEALIASENEFHTLAEAMPQIVWITRPDGGAIYFNQKWADYTGLTLEESLGDGWKKPFHPDERQQASEAWRNATATIGTYSLESRLRRADGVYRWWLVRGVPLLNDAGAIIKWFGTYTDIHDLKTAEIKIGRLNRVYSVLSGINSLIVRANDRDTLFSEACRIAVEAGGFRMSMICLVDAKAGSILSVATAGKDDELLAKIKATLESSEETSKTLVAQAIREKKAVVVNDSRSDARVLFRQKYTDSGVRSMVILPVIVSDEVVAVLALYADEPDVFDDREMRLLTELVGDIAFAIDTIDKRKRLDYLAYYDPLTGLANRRLFLERVAQYIRGAASGRGKIALLLIDLERFKNINDSLGWPAGDALLKQVAAWLSHHLADANLIARLDADHFAVVLPDLAPDENPGRRLEDMTKALSDQSFQLGDTVFRISATLGVACFPDDGSDSDSLFRNAEAALKRAKARGDRYLFYTQAMTEAVAGKLTLETQLREALEKGEFVLHYQPKVSLANGKVTGAEALIRWNNPRTGLVPPSRFIPDLEETGLIHDVGRWALRTALADYLRWRAAGLAVVRLAVNVSPLQLRNPGFVAEIEQAIGEDAQTAVGLELEITENVIMQDVSHSIASLRAIRAMGITVAIDDFGTGFSSLSYLAKLPVDCLKIDRSFVIDMTASPEALALVSTIVSLAHGIKLKVVAEGVETDEQFRLLRLLGCDEMQGYFFSKPIPADTFEAGYLDRL